LSVEKTSNEFIVDETPPFSGWVSIVSPSATDFNVTKITSRYTYACDIIFIATNKKDRSLSSHV
jgi:hypothetical protein